MLNSLSKSSLDFTSPCCPKLGIILLALMQHNKQFYALKFVTTNTLVKPPASLFLVHLFTITLHSPHPQSIPTTEAKVNFRKDSHTLSWTFSHGPCASATRRTSVL